MQNTPGTPSFFIYICPLGEPSLKDPAKEEAAAPGALLDWLLSPSPASPQGLRICPIPASSQSGVGEPFVPGIPQRSWRWGAKPGPCGSSFSLSREDAEVRCAGLRWGPAAWVPISAWYSSAVWPQLFAYPLCASVSLFLNW